MTSATEVLRRMLDERGVEYETYIEQPTGFEHVKWNFNEHGSADFNLEFGEPWLTMYGVISGPEQAIAATLGPFKDQFEADMWDMFMSGGPWIVHSEYMKLKAEYDELKATLGSCNCSNNCTNSERTETCYDTGESRIFHCSECGIGLDDVYIDDEQHYSFADFPRFCPWCGAKVVSA